MTEALVKNVVAAFRAMQKEIDELTAAALNVAVDGDSKNMSAVMSGIAGIKTGVAKVIDGLKGQYESKKRDPKPSDS